MSHESVDLATRRDTDLRDRARKATDAIVEARGNQLSTVLDSGSVVDIELAFYDLFLDVYVSGYRDGRSDSPTSHPAHN